MHDHSNGGSSHSLTSVRSGAAAPLIALTGNPNSGKTTLFNQLTGSNQKVANYSGVTVELREGVASYDGVPFRILDLPGLYSLSAVSPDEEIARDLIVHGIGAAGRPDLIVQVIDGGRLERSLLLTMQLIEQNIPIVIALNMYDEVARRGLLIDPKLLSERLGAPVIPTVGNKGSGMKLLMAAIKSSLNGSRPTPMHIEFDPPTEDALSRIETICLEAGTPISRGVAIGLLTHEPSAGGGLATETVELAREISQSGKPAIGGSWTDAVTHARYAAISELLAGTAGVNSTRFDSRTARLDHILIHRYSGIPIFLFILYLLFQATFTLGAYPMNWIDAGVTWLSSAVKLAIPGVFGLVIGDGFIHGVGMVLIFLPNILILMMGIHLLEDSGYMARAAFLMDRVMRLMGLHGRAFIPLLMGFGCNVPAMMGSRVLESRRDRLLTLLLIPFMSCSARLPVYVMVTAAFFPNHGGLVIFCLYVGGSLTAVILGKLFSRTILRGQTAPFMLELPPYRWPTLKTTTNLLRFTTKTFLRRIGGVTAMFAVAIWFLSYFPRPLEDIGSPGFGKDTYIYRIGGVIEPVFEPLGFTLPMDIALVSGFVAKEVVAATMGVLFAGDAEASQETMVEQLRRQIPGTAAALAFLVFVLLYTPCLTTVVTLQRESRKWYWTTFSVLYQTLFAWGAAWATFRIATMVMG